MNMNMNIRDRTHPGNCDRYINFAGTEVFKLFCGRISDRRGHPGVNAPWSHHYISNYL